MEHYRLMLVAIHTRHRPLKSNLTWRATIGTNNVCSCGSIAAAARSAIGTMCKVHRRHRRRTASMHRTVGRFTRSKLNDKAQGWWTFVDGQSLGSVAFTHAAPAAEFRLLAESGFAWFSDFTIEELEGSPNRP